MSVFNGAVFNSDVFLVDDPLEVVGGGGRPAKVDWDTFDPVHAQKARWERERDALKAQQEKTERDLARSEARIERIERLRENALADVKLQMKLLQSLREAEELRILYEYLQKQLRQYMDDEDAIAVLLLSLTI